MITETQLRAILQLPARPYSETILYDGTRYFDLSKFEPLSILSVKGTVLSAAATFVANTDYVLNNGLVDFGLTGTKPTLGTTFSVEYQYSPLSTAAAQNALFFANTAVPQEVGPTFISLQGQMTPAGIAYADLLTSGQLLFAAGFACRSIASAVTDTAVKYRRGGIVMDETMKPENWLTQAEEWDTKYKSYINLVRGGRPSSIARISAAASTLVFPPADNIYTDGLDVDLESDAAYALTYGSSI